MDFSRLGKSLSSTPLQPSFSPLQPTQVSEPAEVQSSQRREFDSALATLECAKKMIEDASAAGQSGIIFQPAIEAVKNLCSHYVQARKAVVDWKFPSRFGMELLYSFMGFHATKMHDLRKELDDQLDRSLNRAAAAAAAAVDSSDSDDVVTADDLALDFGRVTAANWEYLTVLKMVDETSYAIERQCLEEDLEFVVEAMKSDPELCLRCLDTVQRLLAAGDKQKFTSLSVLQWLCADSVEAEETSVAISALQWVCADSVPDSELSLHEREQIVCKCTSLLVVICSNLKCDAETGLTDNHCAYLIEQVASAYLAELTKLHSMDTDTSQSLLRAAAKSGALIILDYGSGLWFQYYSQLLSLML